MLTLPCKVCEALQKKKGKSEKIRKSDGGTEMQNNILIHPFVEVWQSYQKEQARQPGGQGGILATSGLVLQEPRLG